MSMVKRKTKLSNETTYRMIQELPTVVHSRHYKKLEHMD
jgi:hypothetical protein